MGDLIDKFVFVRIVKANDIDLDLFQFDYDLTFSVFFMNADKTIYGRYGSRSSIENADKEMTLDGLAKTMAAALEIHEGYPSSKAGLAGKQALKTKYSSPNDFPSLRKSFKSTLDYDGAVTKSCMHCHQVRDAERQIHRNQGTPMPSRLLYPNPAPRVIGLSLDPSEKSTVTHVAPDSAAGRAGFDVGDQILEFGGQRIISIADFQWVLHTSPETGVINATVNRANETIQLKVTLEDGWRQQSDISWRVSSWPLRRMGTGGLLFVAATEQQRKQAQLEPGSLALTVKHVGQYGLHAAAKRAGVKKGDLIISFDGQSQSMTPSQLLGYVAQHTKRGQKIPVVVLRQGKRMKFELPMQR